jgi:hypothetical protein
MRYVFVDQKTKKKYDEDSLAALLYREGEHIVYCDIEGVAVLEDELDEKNYYLIDECGHSVWIDPERFIIGARISKKKPKVIKTKTITNKEYKEFDHVFISGYWLKLLAKILGKLGKKEDAYKFFVKAIVEYNKR